MKKKLGLIIAYLAYVYGIFYAVYDYASKIKNLVGQDEGDEETRIAEIGQRSIGIAGVIVMMIAGYDRIIKWIKR